MSILSSGERVNALQLVDERMHLIRLDGEGRRTGDGCNIAGAVFAPAPAKGHVVHLAMVAAKTSSERKYLFLRVRSL